MPDWKINTGTKLNQYVSQVLFKQRQQKLKIILFPWGTSHIVPRAPDMHKNNFAMRIESISLVQKFLKSIFLLSGFSI